MPSPSVLLIGELAHANKEWSSLSSKYTLKEYRRGTRPEFLSKLKTDFSDIVGLYRSNTSTDVTGPFDAELVSQLPRTLRWICHNGAGYDNIDVPAVNERQISVSSTPVAVDDATADTGILLMLGAMRQAHIPYTALRAGNWRGNAVLGHDPKGKVLGILGMGGIGRVGSCVLLGRYMADSNRQWRTELVHSDVRSYITIGLGSRGNWKVTQHMPPLKNCWHSRISCL